VIAFAEDCDPAVAALENLGWTWQRSFPVQIAWDVLPSRAPGFVRREDDRLKITVSIDTEAAASLFIDCFMDHVAHDAA